MEASVSVMEKSDNVPIVVTPTGADEAPAPELNLHFTCEEMEGPQLVGQQSQDSGSVSALGDKH